VYLSINKFVALLVLAVGVAYAVTYPRVSTSTFKTSQTRVLNNVISSVEDFQPQIDTNTTTTTTAYTPEGTGQILFGALGSGTNAAWYASGTTTNDWVCFASYVTP